ncbi:putative protein TPRXL [Rhodotorula toruloides ATCC 204091]|uniref:Uncharacterized protein n=1 Tax=Rhodotorula toruloides TaxID=5286 RepID=A0A2T0A1P5_RHOTO|nr:putative protein TPRXL [Rhodotorula toruloides ATCC 204091]KAK4330017.1 hypothetical protein RTBOTA2_005339 [Rhodotorula toruloides]PRQ71913.1 hypothetical protein AAT19DRAFT_10028 [Rhodotorula toruloides]
MATHDSTDPHTLSYLSLLPFALTTLPAFSSAASHTLRPLQQPPRPSTLQLKCVTCQAEIVAGLSGSFWVDKGELWASCDGCGWTSRRPAEARSDEGSKALKGRSQFERVKKRRRTEAKRATEVAHPTLLAAKQGRAAVTGATSMSKTSMESRQVSVDETETPSKVPPPSAQTLSEPSHLPISSSGTSRNSSEQPASNKLSANPSPAASDRPCPKPTSARPSPAPSSRLSTPSAASPAPSDSSTNAASKKRKRPKQPSGLAEMIEAKKRKEKEASGGAGLADFLQGL